MPLLLSTTQALPSSRYCIRYCISFIPRPSACIHKLWVSLRVWEREYMDVLKLKHTILSTMCTCTDNYNCIPIWLSTKCCHSYGSLTNMGNTSSTAIIHVYMYTYVCIACMTCTRLLDVVTLFSPAATHRCHEWGCWESSPAWAMNITDV